MQTGVHYPELLFLKCLFTFLLLLLKVGLSAGWLQRGANS
jgi:hypothetical protein